MIYIKVYHIEQYLGIPRDYEFIFNKPPQIKEIISAFERCKMFPVYGKHNFKHVREVIEFLKLLPKEAVIDYSKEADHQLYHVAEFDFIRIEYKKVELGY